ncbi:MAG: phosphomannomutase/phosphoglucomutase [Actinobacteria bacterium]|nr:phosphomannomutase/phosphoglucomutase [Actinomycetota bacterium]
MAAPDLSSIVKAYDVRGLVPSQFDASIARALGAAFAEVIAGPDQAKAAVIGHDMRDSSPELSAAFAAGVRSRGIDTLEIGLASTDELYFASGALALPGAMFTASHNPAAYNGIKLTRAGARPVGTDSGLPQVRDRAQELLDEPASERPADRDGTAHRRDLLAAYGEFLRGLVDLRSSRRLKVVIDAANGMAGLTAPAVLGTDAGLPELPLDIVSMYFDLDGTFPNHEANPLDPKNLVDLQHAVVEHGADLGLAFDGDADRVFVVDERGEPVSASAITALVAEREIAKEVARGVDADQIRIVHNVISSRAVTEFVVRAGAQPVRTRVGHSYIKAEMARHNAIFGGEHSAHYYFRAFWFADTGMLAAMHVLAALGEQDGPLSDLVAAYSPYAASGEINSTVTDAAGITERVAAWCAEQGLPTDTLDGLTAWHRGDGDSPMWWINLRSSNTEPLLRLNVEAADVPTMERVRDTVLGMIRA